MAIAPSFAAGTWDKVPKKAPLGVLEPDKI
jgi:hypothetical protein